MTSLYDLSIPVMANILKTTTLILKKGEVYAKEKQIPIADLLASRVYEDMLPLTMQVIIIAGAVNRAIERLTGTAPPGVEGRDKTIDELYEIIEGTLKNLEGVSKDAINGKESTEVPCQVSGKTLTAGLAAYIQGYSLPTVYFHLNIAYAILRSKGVPLGKGDYLTEFISDFSGH
jgi:hypothetical protein